MLLDNAAAHKNEKGQGLRVRLLSHPQLGQDVASRALHTLKESTVNALRCRYSIELLQQIKGKKEKEKRLRKSW